jgi:hypothetical protein
MKKFTEIELAEILRKHTAWVNKGEGGEKADLSGAALKGADLKGADLSNANLSNADLSEADFCNADLSEADLSWTDLRMADLKGADLSNANLRGTNLNGANLRGANLQWTNLRNAIGNKAEIKSMQIEKYDIAYTCYSISIGCETYLISEWRNFNDNQISAMDKDMLEWWKRWKDHLFKMIEMSPAEIQKQR